MTIYWTFYNLGSKHFEAHLEPSVGDHIFSFNLGVHTPGDHMWGTASKHYVPGAQAHTLRIQGKPGQELILLIRDDKGTEKRATYNVDEYWSSDGDIVSMQSLLPYRKHYEISQGMSEQDMYCKALYKEYQVLDAKTHIIAQDYHPGKKIEGKQVDYQDLMRKTVVAKEIVECCEEFFKDKPGEWHEIKNDARS